MHRSSLNEAVAAGLLYMAGWPQAAQEGERLGGVWGGVHGVVVYSVQVPAHATT